MRTWLILVALLCVPRASPSAGIPENPRIIASVVDIVHRVPPSDPGVFILLVVHNPTEFRGTQFSLVDTVRNRRAVRAEYPLGALVSVELPRGMLNGLLRHKTVLEENQRKLDAGARPETITTSPVTPHTDIGELPRRPSVISSP